MEGHKHYVSIDNQDRILRGYSDAFEQPAPNDICITEDSGRHFELFGEINPTLTTIEGVPLYKWGGEQVVERSEQEIQADIDALPPPPPTDQDRIDALEAAMLEVILQNG